MEPTALTQILRLLAKYSIIGFVVCHLLALGMRLKARYTGAAGVTCGSRRTVWSVQPSALVVVMVGAFPANPTIEAKNTLCAASKRKQDGGERGL